jgi:glyoxylase-like metal-dependent hydrolase (beta-lactamase superfamily II)
MAEGETNSGVIIGSDCCIVLDTTDAPLMVQAQLSRTPADTPSPIKFVCLTRYHPVHVPGVSAC